MTGCFTGRGFDFHVVISYLQNSLRHLESPFHYRYFWRGQAPSFSIQDPMNKLHTWLHFGEPVKVHSN